ncbi:MAG: hypothetical protein JWO94_3004 [Verrucomicrobiaceae bacterium]|nr:hypothetical protein [Verrucomicrobiaceae bacterium]
MLLLIPASLAAHSHEVVELLLGLLCLGGAMLVLVAGVWLRFRAVNVAALVLCGMAALLFRTLSHTGKLHVPGAILCVTALVVGAVSTWRCLRSSTLPGATDSAERIRVRRRKRRARDD